MDESPISFFVQIKDTQGQSRINELPALSELNICVELELGGSRVLLLSHLSNIHVGIIAKL